MTIKAYIAVVLAVVLLLALLGVSGSGTKAYAAEGPYKSYVYNEWNQSKASPNSLLPAGTYTGMDAGAGAFNEPQDLFVAKQGTIYVTDTGNNRIVVLNPSFKKVDVIDKLIWKGKETTLQGPTGSYVTDDGTLYIADKGNGRVLRINKGKQVDLVIEKPEHPLIPKDFKFKPVKVAVDNAGRIYVLSEGQFFGLMQFDKEGHFLGYFGSNKVEVTPAVVVETFWKSILSKEQREGMVKLLPIEYSNLDMDEDGFVYTTTIVSQNSRQEIKKLNPLGNNVLTGKDGDSDFGDKEIPVKKAVKLDSSFVDLAIDQDGFIAGLDRTRGRVFEYDQEGNPIAIFGALGNQKGTFQQPVAVAYWQDSVLVLDAGKRNITRFNRTEYGQLVRKATVLYNQGLYEEAAIIWQEVAKRNMNNEIAYVGMAKALEKQGKYDEAMRYYKLGADRSGYSDTYAQIRIKSVRTHLPLIMSLLIMLVIAYYGYKGYRFASSRSRRKGMSA
ncbi:hypothetical protein Back11_55470 [Paenibacillus baekrokdamisoli]|uniref:Uncharacterized protein n=1 Tax=Paenibacillus baekrokdamisoli TaxID=1712516 RepID=A0A3G9J0Y3_9BACL|nr:hypothetical protein [Paenibacillus baekrokdamisoli]MBB3071816.1 DNA-binding beta-propeller fold protein YncE [Paenibacillus baekrokdamisoli]BBH24202.1 hypothetical protein Back11_55470 [Paenibacillus baekrokdamisoli]